MFGRRITLFRLLGFEVRIDASWIIIAVLVTWSLANGFFPHSFPGLPRGTYWIMGIASALAFFLSIIVHEFAHSLVARRRGMPMRGITLFIFGGVAEMGDEPSGPLTEFLVAIAGPVCTLIIAGICYLVAKLGNAFAWPLPVNAVFGYLAWINLVLLAFNLIPAFPLDGGRVFRSILWGARKDITWATRIASAFGSGFAFLLMIAGVFAFVTGNFVAGMWWFLIGMFLRGAAQGSYQQVLVRQLLQGESVRHFMRPDPVTVPPSATLSDLVENYFYKYDYKTYPVVDDHHLLGCVNINQVKHVPRDEWPRHTVGELAAQCSHDNTINADTDAVKALSRMSRTQASRLMVVDGDRLVGVLALKDLMRFLSRKLELEGQFAH
jgi:Zn-dependent protease/CBS domain-containing protein